MIRDQVCTKKYHQPVSPRFPLVQEFVLNDVCQLEPWWRIGCSRKDTPSTRTTVSSKNCPQKHLLSRQANRKTTKTQQDPFSSEAGVWNTFNRAKGSLACDSTSIIVVFVFCLKGKWMAKPKRDGARDQFCVRILESSERCRVFQLEVFTFPWDSYQVLRRVYRGTFLVTKFLPFLIGRRPFFIILLCWYLSCYKKRWKSQLVL